MAGRANIGATLTLNNGNFFTNMKSAVTASKKLYTSLNGTTGGLKKMGTQSDKAGASMSSLVKKAAGVAAAYIGVRQAVNFGRDIVKTGVDFEQGMAEVQAISGATGSAFQTLKDKAKEMGAITKFSALESAEAMKYMGMARVERGTDGRRHRRNHEPGGSQRRGARQCVRYCDGQPDRLWPQSLGQYILCGYPGRGRPASPIPMWPCWASLLKTVRRQRAPWAIMSRTSLRRLA